MPSRKQFIERVGASCKNWGTAWSFVNHASNQVIFGLWEDRNEDDLGLILSSEWERSVTGRKLAGYSEAIEYLRLVAEKNYQLFTFPMTPREPAANDAPVKIHSFEATLTEKVLVYFPGRWYAVPIRHGYDIPDGVVRRFYVEGAVTTITVNAYERNRQAREACVEHYGYCCRVCDFNFERSYGARGENYIHVHHLIPLSTIAEQYVINPITDLIPVCPNCHAMIHRNREAVSIQELRDIVEGNRNR